MDGINCTEYTLDNVNALHSDILVRDMYFGDQKTQAGLILLDDNAKSRGIYPRWGKIAVIGPEQKDVDLQVGYWILIAHGRWSRGFVVKDPITNEDITLRKIDPNDILLVSQERPSSENYSIADYI